MRIVVLALSIALAGCLPKMVKPGASPKMVAQDKRECAFEASKATAAVINPWDKGYEQAKIERQCLEVRGYQLQ